MLYFASQAHNSICRFSPSTHEFTEWTVPTSNSLPYDLAVFSGSIYFTESNGGKIGRLDVSPFGSTTVSSSRTRSTVTTTSEMSTATGTFTSATTQTSTTTGLTSVTSTSVTSSTEISDTLTYYLDPTAQCVSTSGGNVCFDTGNGFSSLSAVALNTISPPPPSGYTFPYGLFSFTITGLSSGGVAVVTITLPAPLPAGTFSYWKFQSGTWTQFSSASLDSTRTIITLTLTADSTGTVTDPGGPAITAIAPAIPEYPLGLPLLAIFMIFAYGLIKHRTRNPKNT